MLDPTEQYVEVTVTVKARTKGKAKNPDSVEMTFKNPKVNLEVSEEDDALRSMSLRIKEQA